jgi:septal ring factor EnvC (AmiA/AmiB activator)
MEWYSVTLVIALGLLALWLYADLRTTREERASFMKTAGKEFKEAQRLTRELAAQQALVANLTATVRGLRVEDGANAQTLEDYRKQLTRAQTERDEAQKEACYAADERDAAKAEFVEAKRRAVLVLRQWAECVEVGGWPPAVA